MRVLITGATGFLGSHLCERMVAQGHKVRILCRPTSSFDRLARLPFEKVVGDITDPKIVQAAVKDCECVIHAAANLNYWRTEEDWQMKVNIEGTRHVARASREAGAKRLLHVSSAAAIGVTADPQQPANEDFPFNLERSGLTYHISKRRADEKCAPYSDCPLFLRRELHRPRRGRGSGNPRCSGAGRKRAAIHFGRGKPDLSNPWGKGGEGHEHPPAVRVHSAGSDGNRSSDAPACSTSEQ